MRGDRYSRPVQGGFAELRKNLGQQLHTGLVGLAVAWLTNIVKGACVTKRLQDYTIYTHDYVVTHA